MKLYYAPGTCSLAAWITLEWSGADYEVERVEIGSEEYKKINPMGAVPSIELEDGQIRTQLEAIIQYIANKYPEADLGPGDNPEDILEYQEASSFLSADIHPTFKPLFGPGAYTTERNEEALEAITNATYENIDSIMEILDEKLEGKDHVFQDKRTGLDAMAYVFSTWTEITPKSWKEYPNIAAFVNKMNEDEAVQKVMKESADN